jgi:hypothetical protein
MTSLQQEELVNKPQPDPQHDEPSRDDAFQSLLMRKELSDVTLRASDGTLVYANRCILASRSAVFCGMLNGPFKEASNSVVDVGYDGKILQYCQIFARTRYPYVTQTRAPKRRKLMIRAIIFTTMMHVK